MSLTLAPKDNKGCCLNNIEKLAWVPEVNTGCVYTQWCHKHNGQVTQNMGSICRHITTWRLNLRLLFHGKGILWLCIHNVF